jgi:hypothetical protein
VRLHDVYDVNTLCTRDKLEINSPPQKKGETPRVTQKQLIPKGLQRNEGDWEISKPILVFLKKSKVSSPFTEIERPKDHP